jgi:hypothetical protein
MVSVMEGNLALIGFIMVVFGSLFSYLRFSVIFGQNCKVCNGKVNGFITNTAGNVFLVELIDDGEIVESRIVTSMFTYGLKNKVNETIQVYYNKDIPKRIYYKNDSIFQKFLPLYFTIIGIILIILFAT